MISALSLVGEYFDILVADVRWLCISGRIRVICGKIVSILARYPKKGGKRKAGNCGCFAVECAFCGGFSGCHFDVIIRESDVIVCEDDVMPESKSIHSVSRIRIRIWNPKPTTNTKGARARVVLRRKQLGHPGRVERW